MTGWQEEVTITDNVVILSEVKNTIIYENLYYFIVAGVT